MPDIPLRDLLAMQAMNGLISSDGGIEKLKKATNMLLTQGERVEGTDIVAMVAYELADAMLRRKSTLESQAASVDSYNKASGEYKPLQKSERDLKPVKVLTIERGER